jgi:diguanylate cyclase (GGDEF)-like protein
MATLLSYYAVSYATSISVPHQIPWPLVSLALIGADVLPVVILRQGNSIRVDLTAVPIAVGAVFTSPRDLLIAVAVAEVAIAVVRHTEPVKGAFNVLNAVVGTSVARLTLGAVIGTAPPVGWRVVGLCLAVLTFELATVVGVVAAITLSTGWPGRRLIADLAMHMGLVVPINSLLAIVTITVGLVETWGILFLVVPAAGLGLWYRKANTTRDRYANLQLLYDFTVKLSGLSDTDDIVQASLEEARSLMQCEHAWIRLPEQFGALKCSLNGDTLVRDIDEPTPLEQKVASKNESVLMPHGRGARMPPTFDYRDLMAVPVNLGDAGVAVMAVANYGTTSETFDHDDLRFFEAFAANLGTALTSSQRLDRLRLEVAAREHQALHDSLTGLANRILFGQWLERAVDHRRTGQRVAIMLMDLDGFKDINDTLGHHIGDLILKEVGGRVLAAVGPARLAARLGGDEFAFVIPGAASAEEVMAVAWEIIESVSRPIAIDNLVLELRASIGVAMAPQDGADSDTLLRRADVAMYSAKSAKRGVVAYDHEIDQYTKRRLILATELRRAMDEGGLEVWYQPVANMATEEICGLEALLRWRHHELGSVTPNEFIPIAEQSGLIEPLTWLVMHSALRELQHWRRQGYELTMAVNVSARSLLGPDVVERLGRMLNEIGVPPGDLTLEITESLMLIDPDGAERILTQLADLGVKIAIDDFGTGYSSLSRLKRLPVTTVKIDRSFVSSMHYDEGDEAIVRATIELARNMGHCVVAEGVEHQETWDRLLELGCDQVQGYLLAAAMPSEDCRRWLQARQGPHMAPIRVLPSVARGA